MAELERRVWPSPGPYHPLVDRSPESKMLVRFEERVESPHTALIIVDMQNDYVSTGGATDRRYGTVAPQQAIIPANRALLDEARRSGVLVIFVQMGLDRAALYNSGPDLLRRYKRYGHDEVVIKGTWGYEIIDELAPLEGELRVEKHRPSAFTGTDLDLILRSNSIKTCVVTGVVTNGCVNATARDVFLYDYYLVLCSDCVASPRRDLHDAALLLLENQLEEGSVSPSARVIKAWQEWRARKEVERGSSLQRVKGTH